jgi:hypothetical protein
MTVLKNDKELFEALLKGHKVEKVRHAGFGEYIYLKDNFLVNHNNEPANLYKITTNDLFQIYQDKNKE